MIASMHKGVRDLRLHVDASCYLVLQMLKHHLRAAVFRSAPAELSLRWEFLVKVYDLSRKTSTGHVTLATFREVDPALMSRVDHGNRNMISVFANTTSYLEYVRGKVSTS